MPSARQVKRQIDGIVSHLVSVGLSDDQNFAIERNIGGVIEITFPNAEQSVVALKRRVYRDIYDHLAAARCFTVRLPDGALLQMMYTFEGEHLRRHRLAFFPSPYLERYQNDPDVYEVEEVFAEVVSKSVVPFPLRFDFVASAGSGVSIEGIHHPASHLTLGQYKNCRIPVNCALTPYWFVHFILSNLYHTAFRRYADRLPVSAATFGENIASRDRRVVYVTVPSM
jgi:hypothetical protein